MERNFRNLAEFERHLAKMISTHDPMLALGMKAVAVNTKDHIQDVIGDNTKLIPNAPATIAQKGKDAPLEDTGQMRASLEAKSVGFESGVGTEDIKMLWHEIGDPGKYPPRPAMKIGTDEASLENQEIVKLAAQAVLGAEGRVSVVVTKALE